jgi:hypothetical protein
MTATKYALVPVVATEEMKATFRAEPGSATQFFHAALQCADFDGRYSHMLAAAPKELPEEVVTLMERAYERAYDTFPMAGGGEYCVDDAHKAGLRAALLAVTGD